MMGKVEFWNAIIAICKLYDIDSLAISKAIRILTAPENEPNSREIYYLLNNRLVLIYLYLQEYCEKELIMLK